MYVLPDLCDEYPELIRVVTPFFSNSGFGNSGFRNFGGRASFGGEIVTIKCYEDNSLVASHVEQAGAGKVLVVDGGGSMRCGLLGDNLALKAAGNGWEGVIVNGCIRDVDIMATIDLGVQALASHPMKSVKRDIGLASQVLTFGGVDFIPGQFVYADNNGIIVAERALPKK